MFFKVSAILDRSTNFPNLSPSLSPLLSSPLLSYNTPFSDRTRPRFFTSYNKKCKLAKIALNYDFVSFPREAGPSSDTVFAHNTWYQENFLTKRKCARFQSSGIKGTACSAEDACYDRGTIFRLKRFLHMPGLLNPKSSGKKRHYFA